MEAKGQSDIVEATESKHLYHQPRRPSVLCADIVLPQREFVHQGYTPKKALSADSGPGNCNVRDLEDPRNILKNTKDIIWPIITRRGSLEKNQYNSLDYKSGVYLGPPESPGQLSTRRNSVDTRRPSLITFLEEEKMKASNIKQQFYTPQPRRKSMNASKVDKNNTSGEDNGGVYLGPSEKTVTKKPPLPPHPTKVLRRMETRVSLVCSMLSGIPQREFVEAGYDPTEAVRGRLDSIDSPKSRPSLSSTTIAKPSTPPVVSSVLVRQESVQSVGSTPRKIFLFYGFILIVVLSKLDRSIFSCHLYVVIGHSIVSTNSSNASNLG